MLISVSPDRADGLMARLRETYPAAQIVGRVIERVSHSIIVLQ
jgi:hydrogenase maturation factor